jgi:AcrR family transcriptional regulator
MSYTPSQSGVLASWPELLEAVRRLALRGEWGSATMDDIARESGVSRVTLYRRGATRTRIVEALREALAHEERDALWPAVASDGTARERLEAALHAYCAVSERNLELFEVLEDDLRDAVYHEDGLEALTRREFTDPLRRLLLDGAVDGSLRRIADPAETATVLYNMVGWTYQHLRRGHRWSAERASGAVIELAVSGLAP